MEYFDELIVREIRNKNEVTLQEVYKKHFPMIAHLICSNNGTEQDAKDLYQEAVINFYERVQQPQFTLTCRIKTYLYAVCWRLWLKRLGEKSRYANNVDVNETFPRVDEEVIDVQEKEERYASMTNAMNELGEPCLGLIKDYYMENLSMEMISQKYGYTNADNAKNQKYKCLQRLKKLFFKTHTDRK